MTNNFKAHHINATPSDFEGNNGFGRYILLPGSDGRAEKISKYFSNLEIKKHPRCHNLYKGVINRNGIKIDVGSTEQLKETILPANATDKTVIWSSSNESVATVSDRGVVTALSEGYQRGEWAKRNVKGEQTLYYSIDVVTDEEFKPVDGWRMFY